MKKGLDYRYQGLSKRGAVLKTGSRLMDVEGMGVYLIIDYKLRRYAYQPLYPPTRQDWRRLTLGKKKEIADSFRRGR